MEPVAAYLGLGSNLGQRQQNLAAAGDALQGHPQITVTAGSSIYETAPWGYTEQPHFLNCVLEIVTTLEPVPLLELAIEIETRLGREPGPRFGPRLVDIDLLLYGNQTVNSEVPDLQIPHPRMAQRAFVLVPLAELAGDLPHPVLAITIEQLLQQVEGKEGVRWWGPGLELYP
ncbi:MAG: 2-amino-4-hydroxy-6-hydroxymethyldihydropteridine diphosphokinase [Dehalococcoidia bacterium]